MNKRRFYIVRLRADDSIVAVGNAEECAASMGLTVPSFRSTVSRCRGNPGSRYEVDVEIEEDGDAAEGL